MINFIQDGLILTVAAPDDVDAGQLIKVGGLIGVCASDAASGDDVEIQLAGCFRLPKATGFVPAAGDVAYFDFDTDLRLESIGYPIGFYTHDALTGDTFARVIINPAFAAHLVEQMQQQGHVSLVASAAAGCGIRSPFASVLAGLYYYTATKPSSALGAATMTFKNGAGGNTVINAASLNLETMTEDAITALTLTGTPADLVFAAGGLLEVIGTSDNADLVVGSGIDIFALFTRT